MTHFMGEGLSRDVAVQLHSGDLVDPGCHIAVSEDIAVFALRAQAKHHRLAPQLFHQPHVAVFDMRSSVRCKGQPGVMTNSDNLRLQVAERSHWMQAANCRHS